MVFKICNPKSIPVRASVPWSNSIPTGEDDPKLN